MNSSRRFSGPGTAIFAWDARGHGRSPGERGDAENFSVYVRDLEVFARQPERNARPSRLRTSPWSRTASAR